jgi:hypothetical protein
MDSKKEPRDYSWLPREMPGVAKLMRERRAKYGNRHVNECFRRSVEKAEPDWFFAREGPLAVGTPFQTDQALVDFQSQAIKSGQAMVLLREPEVNRGSN